MSYWEIYDQYHAKVRRFILSMVRDEWVVDDLIQETFLRVQKSLDSIKDPSRMSSWIYRTAYNLCQDHFRESRISTNREGMRFDRTENFEEPSIQKALERREMGQCVQNQMNLLPKSLRTVLVLYDIMEFSHQEIAEILGITVENAKVRLHRARGRLKTVLEEKCTLEVDERNVLTCEPAGR